MLLRVCTIPVGFLAAANLIGCSAAERRGPDAAIGSWTLAVADGQQPLASSIVVSQSGFDRTTVIESGERQIEVSESGSWTPAPGGDLRLTLNDVMLVITEPGDVSVESYEPDASNASSARLRLVGDRLVLEMLSPGQPITRYAYRRD